MIPRVQLRCWGTLSRNAACLILAFCFAAGNGRAQETSSAFVRIITPYAEAKAILNPTSDQCTNPPQTIVHLSSELSRRLGQVRGEYWYRVQLGGTGFSKFEEILELPPDKRLEQLCRDTLLARSTQLAANDQRKDKWLFHRVVLLTSDDEVYLSDQDRPSAGKFTERDSVDAIPEVVKSPPPEYPMEEWGAGHGGHVVTGAWIDRDGKVRYALVIQSSGFKGLDSAAVRTAYRYKFQPATSAGKPVAVWMGIDIGYETDWPLVTDHRVPRTIKPDHDGNYPQVYSPDILDSIVVGLPEMVLAYPAVTVVPMMKDSVSIVDGAPVFVWLEAIVKRPNKVGDCAIIYCSRPGEGWEKAALQSMKGVRIQPNQYCSVENGGYLHEVLFVPPGYTAAPETTFARAAENMIRRESGPSLAKRGKVKYPSEAKKIKAAGTVMVEAIVDCTGMVSWAGVAQSSGFSLLDSAATESAAKYVFVPGFKNGLAVPSRVRWRVDFRPQK